jgi:uncharacterized protein YbaP (TraB family)
MKHTILATFFLLKVFVLFSQSSVWEVEKDGAKIYIGGTIHILREQDYPLPEQFQTAFNHSEILVTELDLKEMTSPANMEKLMKVMMYDDERTLKTVLNENVYSDLDSVCRQFGMNLLMMDKFKPSMVIMTLTFQALNKIGVKSEGVDTYFSNKAVADKKSFLFLETFDEQLSFIENMGKENDDEFVRYSIRDLEEQLAGFNDMIDEWKAGKSELMLTQLLKFEQDYPEIYKTLLVNRNTNWILLLESYFETPEVEFVLFGAMHLYGSSGILQQLQSRGYNIRQL